MPYLGGRNSHGAARDSCGPQPSAQVALSPGKIHLAPVAGDTANRLLNGRGQQRWPSNCWRPSPCRRVTASPLKGIPPADVAEWEIRLDPSEVSVVRVAIRQQLADWGLRDLGDLTAILVSELVTNALQVDTSAVSVRLMLAGRLMAEVSDDDHNLPHLRRTYEDHEHGRGLLVVSNLSRRWGTSRKAAGKVVWFELPLSPAD